MAAAAIMVAATVDTGRITADMVVMAADTMADTGRTTADIAVGTTATTTVITEEAADSASTRLTADSTIATDGVGSFHRSSKSLSTPAAGPSGGFLF